VARGFESKSVASQQEATEARASSSGASGPDPAVETRRRRLELSRADVERRLAAAHAEAHREILRRALEALAAELGSLGKEAGGGDQG
jgi:hypothetical protein